jgi:hypothetical protein
VAGGRSTERERRPLSPAERIVCAGAITVAVSMLFPWYGISFSRGLSVTALDSFGFAHAALLLTVGAAVLVVAREAIGHPLARPLRPAALVVIAGAWAVLLCCYLIADRPDELGGTTQVGIRFGAFVALAGCVAIVVGGMRMRAER